MEKQRLGDDPLETRKEQIRKGSGLSREPIREPIIKKKMTVYVDVNLINVLQAYAYQERKKISRTIEDLIENHLKGKVRKEFLR